jgi:hypothetical protein
MDAVMDVKIDGHIAQAFSKEYVEAVLQEAMIILASYRHRKDTLVVINPRRVAVILDRQALKGTVIPVEWVEQVLDEGPIKARLQKWLSAPAAKYYVMHIAGSWFKD